MNRRAFITMLGGVAAWPLAARAQQNGRMRRVGFLSGLAESDPEVRHRIEALREGLERLGWTSGHNANKLGHQGGRYARSQTA